MKQKERVADVLQHVLCVMGFHRRKNPAAVPVADPVVVPVPEVL